MESVANAISTYSAPQTYTPDEEAFLLTGKIAFDLFSNSVGPSSSLASLASTALPTSSLATPSNYRTATKLVTAKVLVNKTSVFTRAVAPVIQAPAPLVLAYCMDNTPNHLRIGNDEDPDVISEGVSSTVNDHHKVLHGTYKAFPLTNRELVLTSVWRKDSSTDYFAVVVSCEHPDHPRTPDFIRMTLNRAIKVTALSPTTCSLTVVSQIHLNGVVPMHLNRLITVPMVIAMPLCAVTFVATIRQPDAYDAASLKELGMVVVHTLHAHRGNAAALKSAANKCAHRIALLRDHAWLGEVLFHVVRNKIRPPSATTASLEAFRQDSSLVAQAGQAFATKLVGNVTTPAAVDEWIESYPALVEFDQAQPFFRPFMNSVATEVALRATFGAGARAFAGASLSFLDTISDIYIINLYFEEGRTFYAWILVCMISANILLQLTTTFYNTREIKENRKRRALLGVLSVLTFTKPGMDAWNIASGMEQLEGSLLTPMQDYVVFKCVEMFTEALPGFTLQSLALITSEKISIEAALSLLVSAASAGLCSAALTYDTDTDMPSRKLAPHIYGMIPNTGRGLAYTNLFAMATLLIIAKGISVVLLFVTKPSWLWYYVACDYSLYFGYKAVTKDLWTFIAIPSAPGVVIAMLYRIGTKFIVDFSGTLLFRLPDELGGAYYSFNTFTTLTSVLLSVHLYNEYYEANEESGVKMSPATLWILAGSLLTLWALSFAYFMVFVCVPKHRKSFYSLRTGWRHSCGYFLDSESDLQRIAIFDCNRKQWAHIAGDVKAWTMASWEGWVRDSPEWFTPYVKSTVPDEFIPPRFLTHTHDGRERSGSAAVSIQRNTSMSAIVRKKSILGGVPSFLLPAS
jgi:hypothetical protein